jgi:hypothetical protein
MADNTSVGGGSFIPRQKYMVKTADLGLDEVKYDSITFKICMAGLQVDRTCDAHLHLTSTFFDIRVP